METGTEFVVATKAGDRFVGVLVSTWTGEVSTTEQPVRMFTFSITEGGAGQPTRLDVGDRYSVVDGSIASMTPRF